MSLAEGQPRGWRGEGLNLFPAPTPRAFQHSWGLGTVHSRHRRWGATFASSFKGRGTFVSIHVGSPFFAERSAALWHAKCEVTPSRAGAQRRVD